MSKGVSKHCSILNYLRRADADLHELIQDLCLGKMFMPRRDSPGVTFLRPDKALLGELRKMATGDQPEDAVTALQSMVLLDSLPSLKDFDEKKSDIPTYLRKKLAVVSVDGKKVVLKNGAEIEPDKDFQARSDRGNLNVYIVSKELPPIDGDDADFSNAKKPQKKGGADLAGGRRVLFERVLDDFERGANDTGMELLVALHGWAVHKDNMLLARTVASKSGYDTLASLAIVLQPYKSSPDYLTDEELSSFASELGAVVSGKADSDESRPFSSLPGVYSLRADVEEHFDKMVNGCDDEKGGFVPPAADGGAAVKKASREIAARMGKLNAVRLLSDFYNQSAKSLLPDGVRVASSATLFAEAELRVMSAMLLENSPVPDVDELRAVYRACSLGSPYMCGDKDLIAGSNLGFYYSTVYLIARSNALLHCPGVTGGETKGIANDDAFIDLNLGPRAGQANRRNASALLIRALKNQTW